MLIYLDMRSIHSPLDDKTKLRIQVESEAVLAIIALSESGTCELVSSAALGYEAGRNPRQDRRAYAHDVLSHARRFVELSPEVEERARAYNEAGLKPLDALHLSCAIEAGADYLCTCGDRFLKPARTVHSGPPKVVNPLELIREIGA